ncbi:hypothetical protein BU189_15855, partial [Enterococcus faecium]
VYLKKGGLTLVVSDPFFLL